MSSFHVMFIPINASFWGSLKIVFKTLFDGELVDSLYFSKYYFTNRFIYNFLQWFHDCLFSQKFESIEEETPFEGDMNIQYNQVTICRYTIIHL